MDLLSNLNAAMNYIEEHLDDEIDYAKRLSVYIFQNIILKECFHSLPVFQSQIMPVGEG